jgi:hypothetical protein
MPASKSFARSRRFEAALAAAVVLTMALQSALVPPRSGLALLDGDAGAHLDIARRVFDSRTPGVEQIGTAWLPLPHLVMAPFAARDDWWRSGQAGSLPSSLALAVAAAFLGAAARRAWARTGAAIVAASILALNANARYLAGTAMTEMLFAAALAGLLWATLWFRDSQSVGAVLAAAAASIAASLTRYEGWFLIPFVSLYLWIVARNKRHAAIFAGLAALAPLSWLAHNQYYYSDALEFYRGPWSALALHRRQVANGVVYPTDHNWGNAAAYYAQAVRLTAGAPVLALAAGGVILGAVRRLWWPPVLLSLPPAFLLWSLHSGGADLYVPTLWPHTSYNLRYAFPALLLAAFALPALLTLLPQRWWAWGALALVASPWIPSQRALLQAEADTNSAARRAVQREAARFLAAHYRRGSGIVYSFGEWSGVLREAGIPLREGLHEGNHPAWDAARARPGMFLREQWALAAPGGEVAAIVAQAAAQGRRYGLRTRVAVKDSVLEIYQRE